MPLTDEALRNAEVRLTSLTKGGNQSVNRMNLFGRRRHGPYVNRRCQRITVSSVLLTLRPSSPTNENLC